MLIVNKELSEEGLLKYDSGFTFGRGVFETILVKDEPLFLKEHCSRLRDSLKKLGIKNLIDEAYLLNIIHRFGIKNCVLKVAVSEENVVVETRKVPYSEENYRNGFKVKISDLKRNPYSTVTSLKTLNYTDNILEREQALREGYNEVLFLNVHDAVAEGSVSNIFFVRNNKILTPELSCGLLDGVVRRWVINNFNVIEGIFTLEDIKTGDEVFLTNSIMGIMKVSSIQDKSFSNSNTTDMIRNRYESFI